MKKTLEQQVYDYLKLKGKIETKRIEYLNNDLNRDLNLKICPSSFSLILKKLEKKGKIQKLYQIKIK